LVPNEQAQLLGHGNDKRSKCDTKTPEALAPAACCCRSSPLSHNAGSVQEGAGCSELLSVHPLERPRCSRSLKRRLLSRLSVERESHSLAGRSEDLYFVGVALEVGPAQQIDAVRYCIHTPASDIPPSLI
jgi:hypothetical protein